jgi:hypothetical protein
MLLLFWSDFEVLYEQIWVLLIGLLNLLFDTALISVYTTQIVYFF